jgi:hypothetical protein
MPSYCWECLSCKTRQDIIRSDIENGPDDKCTCGSTEFKRVIPEWRREQTMKIWGGSVAWHDEGYNKYRAVRDK